jgi:hypothetical protein
MSLTTKTPGRIVPAYNLPRGHAVDRGKVVEAAQETAEAEAPHAAQAAQAAEGRMVRSNHSTTRIVALVIVYLCCVSTVISSTST